MSSVRQLWVLEGARDWACGCAERMLQGQVLWLGEPPVGVEGGDAHQAFRWLGRELDLLVFDAWSGFDPEAFGAAVGAVRGGGLVILLIPRLDEWSGYSDPEHRRIAVHPYTAEEVTGRFLRRLAGIIEGSTELRRIEPGQPLPAWSPPPACAVSGEYRTDDQRTAVQAIEHMVSGHPHRPLVLTSDRGRGKSAALGIAAAHLLRAGRQRIVLTAPRMSAAETVFAHAAALLPGAEVRRGLLRWGRAELCFMAPDELVRSTPPADLLLVDEAAAIPTPLLERLLTRYARIVFATTIHGYEGTGRGFAVRFYRVLDAQTPGWRALRLEQPIRWGENDPVERFVFRALLLDAAPVSDEQLAALEPDECIVERLERDDLAADEATLSQLFGLLVLAHYRTSPLDLRHLLDGPNVSVWVMRWRGAVVATALSVAEGGFDVGLARAVYQGKRRPRGHLIPQSLALHSGFEQAPLLRYERVMRIAVHPALQRRGLGARLLAALTAQAQAEGCDFIGASFGATAELLRFWEAQGFSAARLGLTREAASGSHALIVLRPLSAPGEALASTLRQRFLAHLPTLLAVGAEEVDSALAAALLREAHEEPGAELDDQDRRDIESFTEGWRGYEVCAVAIAKRVRQAFAAGAPMTAEQQALLLAKVIEQRRWSSIVAEFGYSGRAQAETALRAAVRSLMGQRDETGG